MYTPYNFRNVKSFPEISQELSLTPYENRAS